MRLTDIDISYDFRVDSNGRDPDSASPMLKVYHQALWSKPLPDGQTMCLSSEDCSYLRWGDMYFGSDSITTSFRYGRNKELLDQVAKRVPSFSQYTDDYLHKAYTIGGEIIFPKHSGSINQSRGCNRKICDRWDLSLECIRRYFAGESSPLSDALQRDKEFFDLFVDFKGYVDFFLLQDCVDEDYNVKLWLDTPLFEHDPMPRNVDEYLQWIDAQLEFVRSRGLRIAEYGKVMNNFNQIIEIGI